MQIIYDHQIFSLQQYGGISRYFVELANHIADAKEAQVRVLSPIYSNAYLASTSPKVQVTGLKVPMIRFGELVYGAVNRALAGPLVHWFRPDLVHETYYASKPKKPEDFKRLITVFDLIHELFPADFPPSDSTRVDKVLAVARADHVICISENTRRDLVNLLNVPREKTSVVHLGFTLRTGNRPFEISVRRPFLLYVGARNGYKNFSCLLQAYAADRTLMNSFDLIAFGGGVFTDKELQLVRKLNIPSVNLHHAQGSDEVLAELYRRTVALVYPSLYEGFGIPPLEAMSLDCPVICSDAASLPEVVGNAALLFDPHSPELLGQAMHSVLGNESLRQTLISKGRERIKLFSWEKCARETMSIYTRVLGSTL